MDIKTDVETGSSLPQAFRKHPLHFDASSATWSPPASRPGILDALLDRLATYKEKILAIKAKIKSALFYPVSVIVVAIVVDCGHHDLRDPGVQGGVHELRRRPARRRR